MNTPDVCTHEFIRNAYKVCKGSTVCANDNFSTRCVYFSNLPGGCWTKTENLTSRPCRASGPTPWPEMAICKEMPEASNEGVPRCKCTASPYESAAQCRLHTMPHHNYRGAASAVPARYPNNEGPDPRSCASSHPHSLAWTDTNFKYYTTNIYKINIPMFSVYRITHRELNVLLFLAHPLHPCSQ